MEKKEKKKLKEKEGSALLSLPSFSRNYSRPFFRCRPLYCGSRCTIPAMCRAPRHFLCPPLISGLKSQPSAARTIVFRAQASFDSQFWAPGPPCAPGFPSDPCFTPRQVFGPSFCSFDGCPGLIWAQCRSRAFFCFFSNPRSQCWFPGFQFWSLIFSLEIWIPLSLSKAILGLNVQEFFRILFLWSH